jgi:hypothetical protein
MIPILGVIPLSGAQLPAASADDVCPGVILTFFIWQCGKKL